MSLIDYYLIILVIHGFYANPTMTTVGPFYSEQACIEAGEKAKNKLSAQYVCVSKVKP